MSMKAALLATLPALLLGSCCDAPQAPPPAPPATYSITIKPLGPEDKTAVSPEAVEGFRVFSF